MVEWVCGAVFVLGFVAGAPTAGATAAGRPLSRSLDVLNGTIDGAFNYGK